MYLWIIVISSFIYYNTLRTNVRSSGKDERYNTTNFTKKELEKEKLMKFAENMKYLTYLTNSKIPEKDKIEMIQDSVDVFYGINPFNVFMGGLQNDF